MKNQGSIISGLVLITLGVCFLLAQFFPSIAELINFRYIWPLIPLGVGIALFVSGIVGPPGLLIPGTIVSGVGIILFYQNFTSNWHHWQLWLLVPAFVGVGIILSFLREGKSLESGLKAGGAPLAIGLILFVVFTAFTSSFFGILWPAMLILVGIFLLVRSGRKRAKKF